MSVWAGKAERTASTWIEVLQARAAELPDARAYTFLDDGEEEGARLSFAELDAKARALGAVLQGLGMAGERALLLHPPGLEFVAAFLGCLYGGAVAVPAYPPRSARMLPRLQAIVEDARPAVVLTTAELHRQVAALAGRLPELAGVRWVATDELDVEGLAAGWREPAVDGETLAFLQYTSGSTAQPKGVRVSHGNLLHNEAMIQAAFGQSERSRIVGWLPLYHDMGLIGNVLQPLYVGASCVLMSPVSFLQRPSRWLRAISRYRATTSGGPNFAYELCVQRIPAAERHGLDLSSWEVAFNGAEPVRVETLERFAETFAPCGFRRQAFYPCYGLAEATLFVAGGDLGSAPVVESFGAEELERNRVVPQDSLAAAGRRLVGCGGVWSGQQIAIVEAETGRRCAADQVGEIWVAGPSMARGYWGKKEESERVFQARLASGEGPFLRTGDLGFVRGGELFVTGRLKDLIILRGRNLYPQDIELTAELSHRALRPGCGAAFSVDLEGEERLVIVQEVERRREAEAEAGAEAVRRAVAEEHEAQVHDVVLVRMGSIPKTSSGKIQRHACRAAYLAGELAVVGRSAIAAGVEEATAAGPELDREELLAMAMGERRMALEGWLQDEAARALAVPRSRLQLDMPLTAWGLDSLAAIELRARVEQALGAPVSLSTLLEGATLGELAAGILAALPGSTSAPTGLATGSEEIGNFPLSHGQRALWFVHRLAPESLAYHLAGAARVVGPLDPAALARALSALAERHPVLRTTFHEGPSGEPFQRVHPRLAPEFLDEDAPGWGDEEIGRRLHSEVWRPFDLAAGPLLRAGLFRRGPTRSILYLAVHHLVSDYGSLAVMARDLGALYARETGRPSPVLPVLELRYTDWARWQDERLAGPEGERLWRYWRHALKDAPERLEVPTDRPWPMRQTWTAGNRYFFLDPVPVNDLGALARRRGATLYMALLTVFEAVLARYSGQEDLLIGSPTAGRTAALGDLAGYFVNMVAVRVRLPGDPSFTSALDEVRRVMVGAFEHQDFPLAVLAERLQARRDPGRPPLFDIVFAFEKARGAEAGLGGFALGLAGSRLRLGALELESLDLPPAGAPFALSLVLSAAGEGLGACLRFNSDLFDLPTMDRLAEHFRTLMAGALADPQRRLSDLPLLTAAEEWEVLAERNRTEADFRLDVGVHRLVSARAASNPDALAVAGVEERLTFGALDSRANRLARWLLASGVEPETRVGVVMERSPAMVVAMLGVLKARAAYVPLDPAHPPERLAWQLEDAWKGCPVQALLTHSRLAEKLPSAGVKVLCLDADGGALAAWDGADPDLPCLPGSAAYVVYTSGSTGRPKGVAISHAGLANLVAWHCRTYGVTPVDRASQVASPGFDAAVWEIWPYLAAGASLHIPTEQDRTSPPRLVGWLAAEGISKAFLPTPLAEAALGEEWPAGVCLRALLTGGDRLHRGPRPGLPFTLFNHYGPSESTVVATSTPVESSSAPPSIGTPIANTRAYVLDRRLRPLPEGVPGELAVGGHGLARGYLHRPDLTAERFVPDPFAVEPGARLYRTGDFVRWSATRALDFLGRIDQQVKVRGFRIELGEIEAALGEHPAVREAAVIVREDELGPYLVAYLAPRSGEPSALLAPELREHLRSRLPEPMIPSVWELLEALPLTANGKIDRRALGRLVAERAVEAGGYVAPRTAIEARLAEIWAEVLRLERVGVEDDFFELGGHSLLATQLVSRIRESFGVELPLRRLFELATVAALSGELRQLGATAAPPLRRADRAGDLPLSFAQERLWFLDQLAPGSPAYNMPVAVRLSGRLSVAALTAGLEWVVGRHEALRTRFELRGGTPRAWIEPAAPLALTLVDLQGLPPEARETEGPELCRREAARPFDLGRTPLLRPYLLRLETEEWIFLLVLHHIIADGWSLGVLVQELSAAYGGLGLGSEPPLRELPLQYADFAAWQRQWLLGSTLQAELDYWTEQLADAPALLELPLDRPRPAAQSFRGARQRVEIAERVGRGVERLAREARTTPYVVLLAAFAALLGRHAGQEQVVVGSPVAGRTRPELEKLIGLLVNTLALRVDLSGDPPFTLLLQRVNERALAAFDHQDLPLERLVEELAPQRSLAHSPIFQVMFALQTAPMDPTLAGVELRRLDIDPGISKFDLSLDLTPQASGGFSGWLEYSRDLFTAATIERLAERLVRLLAAIAEQPDLRLSELPLLSEAERHRLLVDWSRTPGEYPGGGTIHDLFAAQVRRTPDKAAVVGHRETLTYRELEDRCRRLAQATASAWAGSGAPSPEPLVGLMADAGPRLLVGLLGILRSGATLVPLSPGQPDERIAVIAADCGIEVLVTERRYLDRASRLCGGGQTRVVCLEDFEAPGGAADARIGPSDGEPPLADRLAYVIYTSGSTGVPKGVGISHRNLVPMLTWSREYFALDETTRVLESLSYAFDFGVWEILTTLISGGTLCVPGPEEFGDPQAHARLVLQWEADTVHATPSFMQAVAQTGTVFEGLRRLHLGGEALSRSQAEGLAKMVGEKCHLYNGYGPTEATVNSLIFDVGTPGRLHGNERVPIGRPSAYNTVYLLDPWDRPVPQGVVGELCVGGPGVARGYLGRPALTAEKFVPDPFGGIPGGRLYRTGDLARWLANGDVEFLGRIDDQVKIRGFRIEPGEVEAALRCHPQVREAVVMARENRAGAMALAAYIKWDGPPPSAEELRSFLRMRLPEPMIPSAWLFLDTWPLSPTGKIDRRALPAPHWQHDWVAGEDVPRNPVEEMLAAIWADVLGLKRVGIRESFFDLGGHSLLATQVVSRIRETFGVELPLRLLFELSTVEGLAGQLPGQVAAAGAPLRPVDRSGDLPLSFAQERLWFLDQLEPENPLYNLPVAVRLLGPLDVAALTSALGEIVRRHEALRTIFAEVAGRPVQRIAAWGSFFMPLVDLSELAADSRRAAADQRLREEARRPFDLGSGRLVRAALLRLGAAEHVFALTFHHVAADGWSIGIFLRELPMLYRAFAAGSSSPLAELPVQYGDFAVWQRQWLQGGALEDQLAYWREALAGLPPALDLPVDRPRSAVRGSHGAQLPVALAGALAESVRELARREAVTPFMILLAAFQVLLWRLSGQEDLAVGTAVANRNRLETEPLIGFFVNMLVLRGQLDGFLDLGAWLQRTRASTLGAYAHQDVPFEKLVEELAPARDPSRTPLFQVSLVLQNAPTPPMELPGLVTEVLAADAGGSRFDLTFLLRDCEAGFTGIVEYSRDLFDGATVERLVGHYRVLLQGALADPGALLWDLPLLRAEESRQLLGEWGRDRADWPEDVLLHEFFAAQARRTPEATAVVAGERRLSYRELDELADGMARRLRWLGVGAETRVGVFLQRSERLVITLLGILKAGGAYVPLDPAYPRERLESILSDAEAAVVVSEGGLVTALPGDLGARIVLADEAWPVDLPAPAPLSLRQGALAYVIYTSGSTGRPKGVAIEHRSAAALVHWSREYFRAEELAGVLASTSICFDMSVFELFATLAWGGTVILADNALSLSDLPAREEVTLIDTVPSAMAELLRQGAVPASVRTVNLGGEPLRGSLARQVYGLGTVERLLNLYGPSEDTTFSTVAEVGVEGEPTIGRVLTNSWGYVLDRWLRPVPVGVAGELYLGGAGLSRGYLGRPELTAERYMPDPYSSLAGGRLYRTGDLTRWRADGELEYLGRLDHQVKVRGFRVELGEIEAALLSHPALREAAVVAQGEGGERRLTAYVVAREGEAVPELGELRGYLKEKLPEYMVPSALVALPALPLTPNGKIDRRALGRIEPEREVDADGYVAPRTEVEARLAAIWAEVLQLERVGVEDDFFDLGGHSLLATQVVSRIRETFGVELPLRLLFELSTVEGLAGQLPGQVAAPGAPLRPVDRSGDLPLSFAQERLWFLDQMAPGSAAYNIPVAVRLSGRLQKSALSASLDLLMARHEILRTHFASRGGLPVQVIEAKVQSPLACVDLQGLPPHQREAEALAICGREAARPFDLSRTPLLRHYLLLLEPEESICLLVVHHIISDAWSLGVFLRELATAYAAAREEGEWNEAPPILQYAHYAGWQREWLQGPSLQAELAFWREELAGAPPLLELPLDRPRPAEPSFLGGRRPFEIPVRLWQALERLARESGATPFMVVLAAFAAMLGRNAGQEEVVVGSPVAGRTRPETEAMIGLFVNTLALRVDLSGDPPFARLVERIKARVLPAFDHQDLPFEKLVEELAPARSLSHSPVFQAMLAMQNADLSPVFPGMRLRRLDVDPGTSKFDLSLDLAPAADGGFGGWLEYRRDLFDAATAERFAGQLERLLQTVVREPARKLSELPWLSPAERRQLLAEWSRRPGHYSSVGTVHGLFADQVRKTPDNAAVVRHRETLTYRELDARSSRLALLIKEMVSDREPSVSPEPV